MLPVYYFGDCSRKTKGEKEISILRMSENAKKYLFKEYYLKGQHLPLHCGFAERQTFDTFSQGSPRLKHLFNC